MTDMQKDQVKLIKPDVALTDDAIQKTVLALQTLLADEHVLYMKLRNYHWNVTGPNFITLHELFEEQYTALADTIDDIAERIRSYGVRAIGTLKEMQEYARLDETPGALPPARDMVADLVSDHETLMRHLRAAANDMGEVGNMGEEDLFIGLLQDHQKKAWLLRAHLEG
ncbi:MAG: DNA starvation/stationary phase protection protein [Anaerolineaceae bacterium]|nr:MAG: DNA starvation/stationary phase protection protein [Anaerolineaceae bacterium]